jgi:hypothetical protein
MRYLQIVDLREKHQILLKNQYRISDYLNLFTLLKSKLIAQNPESIFHFNSMDNG